MTKRSVKERKRIWASWSYECAVWTIWTSVHRRHEGLRDFFFFFFLFWYPIIGPRCDLIQNLEFGAIPDVMIFPSPSSTKLYALCSDFSDMTYVQHTYTKTKNMSSEYVFWISCISVLIFEWMIGMYGWMIHDWPYTNTLSHIKKILLDFLSKYNKI